MKRVTKKQEFVYISSHGMCCTHFIYFTLTALKYKMEKKKKHTHHNPVHYNSHEALVKADILVASMTTVFLFLP